MAGRIDSGREFPWRMICIILSLILGIAANVFILVIYGKTLLKAEDAAMLLMKDHAVAWEYLQGKWYSYDGSYYIDCTSENFDSNFPGADKGQVLIEDGVMYFSEYEDMQDMLNWLRLTVKDKDQCEVYCFGENQEYLMYRQQ